MRDFSQASGAHRGASWCIGRGSDSVATPVGDADVVAVCLALRSVARFRAVRPQVHLDFTGQPVTCLGAKTIAAVLQVDCGIRAVTLRRSHVGDEGIAALGAALGGSLVELDLGQCAVTSTGARMLARGMQMHGAPCLEVLLLDGNRLGEEGVVELIALLEGPARPRALHSLSLLPAEPCTWSVEAGAALHLVCEQCGVLLRGPPSADGQRRTQGLQRSRFEDHFLPSGVGPSSPEKGGADTLPVSCVVQPRLSQGNVPDVSTVPSSGRSSEHLAAWMAGVERELREVKWLLSASMARMDGQHAQLIGSIAQVSSQVDTLELYSRANVSSVDAGPDENSEASASGAAALDVLESRLSVLEELVGSESTESLQMQLMEAAARADMHLAR